MVIGVIGILNYMKNIPVIIRIYLWCLLGKDIELDAVSRQLDPTLLALLPNAACWCRPCGVTSDAVMVPERDSRGYQAAGNSRFNSFQQVTVTLPPASESARHHGVMPPAAAGAGRPLECTAHWCLPASAGWSRLERTAALQLAVYICGSMHEQR